MLSSCLNLTPIPDRNTEQMSCHISALCIALPCPKRGLTHTTFGGEEFMEGGEDTHLTPSKHRSQLSLSLHASQWQGDTSEESTFHFTPPFLTKKEEFSTYSSSGFLLERHTTCRRRRKSQWLIDLFSGQGGHTAAVSSVEDQITDLTVLCCISCLLYSWMELKVLVSAHFGKLHTQVTDSEFDLIVFSVEVLVTGSLKFNVQVSKVTSVVSMKYICKLCLIYNLKNNDF